MLRVSIKELVGENAMTLDDGEAVYRRVHDPLLAGDVAELDFAGVEIFASPFFNAGIGRLLADLPADALNTRLRFQNLSPLGDRILRRVIENAKEYYESSPERRRAVDQIVQETVAAR